MSGIEITEVCIGIGFIEVEQVINGACIEINAFQH